MDTWSVTEEAFDPRGLHHKETVFTIGNGYLSTRGAFEEGYPNEVAATFVHGLFDDIPIVMTELVNAPGWTHLQLFVAGERFRLDRGRVLAYRRTLNLRNGTLHRFVRWQSPGGKSVEVNIERFASLADPHLAALKYEVRALDFTGEIELRAGLPGKADNEGWLHWNWLNQGRSAGREAFLLLETKSTCIALSQAMRFDVEAAAPVDYEYWDTDWMPVFTARVQVEAGETVTAEKKIVTYTGRDTADPLAEALAGLHEAGPKGYSLLLEANHAAWQEEWRACDVRIEGDDEADRALRYSLFQLLIAAPRWEDRVSIGAKTLSGYGYRGHVFWDTEIFMLPFFTYTRPEIARSLLLYRFNTLPGARRKASASGYEGAMFAWESAASGDETTPRWVPGPQGEELVRIWCGDIEHHITADVAYGVIQYWQASGDDDFMLAYGAELVLDTARFWGSRAEWNAQRQAYELTDVIGPDEYHDHVDNNAYTNVMARWNLRIALKVLEWLQGYAPDKAAELIHALDLSTDRVAHWHNVIEKMVLGYDPDTLLFEQFEGYYGLQFKDLDLYEPRQISMQALLGIEGVQEYQFIKQPDVLMMLYLLRDRFAPEVIRANYEFYTPRTDLTYGSSLGPAIQALLAARYGDIGEAYRHFIHAARTDLEDVRGNAADGIHGATAGGLWQAAIFGFAGLHFKDGRPEVAPNLPGHWKRLAFNLVVHGRRVSFDIRSDRLGAGGPHIPVRGVIFDLDGVLTDTSELHYRAWKRLADEEGLPFNRADNEALRGVSRRESLLLLLKGREIPEAQLQVWMERKNSYYLEAVATLTPDDLLPGARRLLAEVRAAGQKVAIGSASKNARVVLEKLGIDGLVDHISDGYSVSRQKPAPDLFLNAAEALGIPPAYCLVFEDAEAGVQAAIEGGMWVVGVGPQERVGEAHLVVPDLSGVTWKGLQASLEKRVQKLETV